MSYPLKKGVFCGVSPKKLRSNVLEMLYEGHIGTVKVKQLAHSCVWWPCIDSKIEKLIKGCNCQQEQRVPTAAPLHPSHGPEFI